MILTVTPNTALDRVLLLERLVPNRRHQALQSVEAMGGKGCNVAMVLHALGEDVTATGLAAGESGRRMELMLRRAGVTPDFVWTAGETRINTVVLEQAAGTHTTLCAAGLQPDEHAQAGLLEWCDRWAAAATVSVIAGSLPESWPSAVYGELVRRCRAQTPVIVDASGEALLAGVREGVFACKPNRDELEGVAGPLTSTADIERAARDLQDRGAAWVLVSLGAEGALLLTRRGIWQAEGLNVRVLNPAGAGDGMTACLARAAVHQWDEEETLRQAVAVSAAIVTTLGTAEFQRETAQRLLPQVRVKRH